MAHKKQDRRSINGNGMEKDGQLLTLQAFRAVSLILTGFCLEMLHMVEASLWLSLTTALDFNGKQGFTGGNNQDE